MSGDDARDGFDRWAATYDEDVADARNEFPFLGYDDVLDAIAELTVQAKPRRLLDLGIGSGALAARVVARNSSVEIWGVDFSGRMLALAKARLPNALLIEADIDRDLSSLTLPEFDVVVSTYVFHELPDDRKIALIRQLVEHRLSDGGFVAIGDIAFPDEATQSASRRIHSAGWDDSGHYWVSGSLLPRLRSLGIAGVYQQISECAGIFTFH